MFCNIKGYPFQLHDICVYGDVATGWIHGFSEPDLNWDSIDYLSPVCPDSNKGPCITLGCQLSVLIQILCPKILKRSEESSFFQFGHRHKLLVLAFLPSLVWAIVFSKPRTILEVYSPRVHIPGILPEFKSYITGECSYINNFFRI